MFTSNSRYYGLATVTVTDRHGREVTAVRLRRLPAMTGADVQVVQHDRLDVMCEDRYRDATKYWHVADANTEFEAGTLVAQPGRTIKVPGS